MRVVEAAELAAVTVCAQRLCTEETSAGRRLCDRHLAEARRRRLAPYARRVRSRLDAFVRARDELRAAVAELDRAVAEADPL